jgi:hypothetical protein
LGVTLLPLPPDLVDHGVVEEEDGVCWLYRQYVVIFKIRRVKKNKKNYTI